MTIPVLAAVGQPSPRGVSASDVTHGIDLNEL
jgi:hypothetical protein